MMKNLKYKGKEHKIASGSFDLPLRLSSSFAHYKFFVNSGVSPTVGSILYALLQVIVTALGGMLIDRAGRRPLLMVGNVENIHF